MQDPWLKILKLLLYPRYKIPAIPNQNSQSESPIKILILISEGHLGNCEATLTSHQNSNEILIPLLHLAPIWHAKFLNEVCYL